MCQTCQDEIIPRIIPYTMGEIRGRVACEALATRSPRARALVTYAVSRGESFALIRKIALLLSREARLYRSPPHSP